MDVTSATSAVNQTTSTTSTLKEEEESTSSASSTLATDFDTYLTLLTAQLKNQDPMEPVESTQFIEQLATFSSVEQQIATNDKLDQLIEASGGDNDIQSLADWIGKDVEYQPDAIRFDGQEVRFAAPEQGRYEGVTAVVKNAEGEAVRTMDLSGDDTRHVWDGATDDGVRAPNGNYTIELTYRSSGLAPKTDIAPLADRVTEVRKTDDGWRLQLDGGGNISVDAVTAARPAQEEQPTTLDA
ncbi:MAG: flagellar hook capping FlgD N-terminal domain-containing protein [Pseudomonadota bacterium]